MMGFEISMVEYAFAGLVSLCCLLGGAVIKQDRGRIDDLEEKQEEDHTLLSEMNGKLDVVIDLIKNGVKDKRKEIKKNEYSDLGR